MPSHPGFRRILLFAGAVSALSGCASIGENVDEAVNDMLGDSLTATLSGGAATPPGDPDGQGSAQVTVNDATNEICTDLQVGGIGEVTAAHIHRGLPGAGGPAVITLAGAGSSCDTESGALVDEIRHSPGRFYVDVHTAAYPKGAIRGQLQLSAN